MEKFWTGLETSKLLKAPHSNKKKTTRAKPKVVLVADFETTTDASDCRVWAWGYVDVSKPEYDNVITGTDINSFIEVIKSQNSHCYFHNLKFDGMFILDFLLNDGYAHDTGGPHDTFMKGTFRSLISDMGKFYSIKVKWRNGNVTEFRDSLKKLPMTVKKIATSFNLDMTKGDIDYDTYREPGHALTDEELDYLKRDVVIVAKAMHEVLLEGMTKLTVGSDSISEFKRLKTDKWFEKTFPVLSQVMDADIRRAYRGGFTYADDRFKGKIQRGGLVLDVNSLYPSVMYTRALPYGDPEYFKGSPSPTKSHPLVIFSVTVTACIKRNHIPCIQIKGSSRFVETEYLRAIREPTTLFVTDVDWKLYNDHYDITVIEYGGGWRFRSAVGMFTEYIDKWGGIKAASKGGKREIAKLHLNSLYGKFATNPNVTSKIPSLDKGIVRLKRGAPETRDPVYTPMGVFITAYAREVTIRSAQQNYKTFAYADTDSLHLLQDDVPSSIDVHPTKLGAWKHEYDFINSYYIRAKAYLERVNVDNVHTEDCDEGCKIRHDYVNRIAGLPLDISGSLTFEDIRPGLVLHGKLTPKTVRGGVVLKDVPFELKL